MKTFIKSAFPVMLCLAIPGAWAQTNTKVTGTLKELKEGTVVYLSPLGSSLKKDSVIAGKGKFRFNLALKEGDVYLLQAGKNAAEPGAIHLFYLEPGMVNINGKGPLLSDIKLSGSRFVKEQNDLGRYMKNAGELKGEKEINAGYIAAVRAKDAVKIAALRPRYTELDSVRKVLYKKWVSSHPASPVSAMVLSFYVRENNMEALQDLLDQLEPAARQNALARKMQYSIDAAKATAVGKPAPDFVQNNPDGRPVALKDFRGKYVLIDFWASWCVPCLAENPHVVSAFNHLKDKNFTVLGVSLDRPDGKERWIKAIQDDGLTWTHISDLKHWDNEVSRQYDIKAIPANLLIGPDGVILAKNLRGEDLEEKLKQFIK